MFRNLIVYALAGLDKNGIDDAVAACALQPCTAMQMDSIGWARPRENEGGLVYVRGEQVLLAYGEESRLLPGSVVARFVKLRVAETEEQQGFKPGRKQMKEIKEAVTNELLPKAFVINKSTLVWLDLAAGLVMIDASSQAKADEVVTLLCKTFTGIALKRVTVASDVVQRLTEWVLAGEVPGGVLSIDRDCELSGNGAGMEKSAVRYVKHNLGADEGGIRPHIEAGKLVSKLAMTWSDRVSFVVDDKMCFKRIALLDVVKEQAQEMEAEAFDADFLIFAGEFGKLWADWVEVMGGVKE